MVGAGRERFRKLTLRLAAVVTIVLLAALAAIAIAYRQPIAKALLMRQFHNLGLEQVEFAVRHFDAGVLELENLSVGDGDGLDVARIEARFSVRGLFATRLDALEISGVRLRGTLDEEGLSFGSLDSLFENRAAGAKPNGPSALPASGVGIEDAQLELTTPDGLLSANLELQAVEIAAGKLEAEARLKADHALANLDAHLSASGSPTSLAGEVTLEANAAGEFGFDISASAVSLAAKAAFSFENGDIAIQPKECVEIQIDRLSVESVLTLLKPLDLCLRSRADFGIRTARDGDFEIDFEIAPAAFEADLRVGGEIQRVSGEVPTLQLRGSRRAEEFEASLETEGGRLEFAKHAVGLHGIELEASLSRGAVFPKGQLRIEEITDSREVSRFSKLAMSARFEPRDGSVDFAIEAADPNRDLVIDISGTHDLAGGVGRAALHLHAIDFEPGRIQPAALFPILSELLTEASGSIEMKGSAEWNTDGVRGTVEVAASDVSIISELATVEHLNAIVELNEDGATLQDQILSIGRLDFGLELTDGLIRYQLKSGGIVEIAASWKLAGGVLTNTGEVDLQSENREILLVVKGVDLTQLIELVNLDGLSGSGTLEGELPIALVGGEVQIHDAVLRSSGEAGLIQYRPGSGMSNVADTDPNFATTLTVLENFHYDRLEIEVDGSATGTVVAQIHLAGANPDYRGGYPVEFNLSMDARLSDLLRTGKTIYEIPKKIEEQLRAFAEKEL